MRVMFVSTQNTGDATPVRLMSASSTGECTVYIADNFTNITITHYEPRETLTTEEFRRFAEQLKRARPWKSWADVEYDDENVAREWRDANFHHVIQEPEQPRRPTPFKLPQHNDRPRHWRTRALAIVHLGSYKRRWR